VVQRKAARPPRPDRPPKNSQRWGGIPLGEWCKIVVTAVLRVAEDELRERLLPLSSLDVYRSVKSDLVLEPFLNSDDVSERTAASLRVRLRSGAHDLEVSAARRRSPSALVPRAERFCRVCNSGAAEDVEHFLLDCQPLQHGRDAWRRRIVAARRSLSPGLIPEAPLPRGSLVAICLGKWPAPPESEPSSDEQSVLQPSLDEQSLLRSVDSAIMQDILAMFRSRQRILLARASS
jgi:hypothetical protein